MGPREVVNEVSPADFEEANYARLKLERRRGRLDGSKYTRMARGDGKRNLYNAMLPQRTPWHGTTLASVAVEGLWLPTRLFGSCRGG